MVETGGEQEAEHGLRVAPARGGCPKPAPGTPVTASGCKQRRCRSRQGPHREVARAKTGWYREECSPLAARIAAGGVLRFRPRRQSLPLEGKVPNEVRRMRWNANHDGAPIACGGMNAGAFHHSRGLAAKARCHLIRRWRDSFPSRGSQRRGRKRNLRKKPTHKRQKRPSFQTIPNRNERIL